jgi:hypothetical protein
LRTFIVAISWGLSVLRMLGAPETAEFSMGTPSMTISGSLLALSEAPPRMRIRPPAPGEPSGVICTPATLPTSRSLAVEIAPFWKLFSPMEVIEPVRSFFCIEP